MSGDRVRHQSPCAGVTGLTPESHNKYILAMIHHARYESMYVSLTASLVSASSKSFNLLSAYCFSLKILQKLRMEECHKLIVKID